MIYIAEWFICFKRISAEIAMLPWFFFVPCYVRILSYHLPIVIYYLVLITHLILTLSESLFLFL